MISKNSSHSHIYIHFVKQQIKSWGHWQSDQAKANAGSD